MEAKIAVEGLAEFNKALRQIDKEAPKQLRLAFNGAADLLISRTRPKIPKRTGAAAGSLKAKSTRTSARVSVGGTKARYYPWLDFGGAGKKSGRPSQRPFITEGRYLYPTLREIGPQIQMALDKGIRDVARGAGLDVD